MLSHLPKVTIVTVTYNAEKYLERTIRSVVKQSYPNIEYIVIDGASADGTVDIIKKYEQFIDYWISEPDSGIYHAMNKGVDAATGEWMSFMNAGDGFSNMDVLRDVFCKEYDADVLYSDTYIVDKDFKTVGEHLVSGLEDFFISKMPFIHQSSFVRRSLVSKFPFRTDYNLASDFDLFFKLYVKKYKFEYLPDVKIAKFLTGGVHTFNMIQYTSEALNTLITEYPDTRFLTETRSVIRSFDKYNNKGMDVFPVTLSLVLSGIDEILTKYDNVALYGYGLLGRLIYSYYSSRISFVVDRYFVNNDASLPVVSLQEIKNHDFDIVLISLIGREKEIADDLVRIGVPEDKIVYISLYNIFKNT